MSKKKSWTDGQLIEAVNNCTSYAQVIRKLGLIPAGGNYVQVQESVKRLGISTEHFTGMLWNKGISYHTNTRPPISQLLILGSKVQSYKLKNRLYEEGIKTAKCEMCGWAEKSLDGRVPLELDHINGNRHDNRLENLRVLCPNCHSLQPTHRGRNKKARPLI